MKRLVAALPLVVAAAAVAAPSVSGAASTTVKPAKKQPTVQLFGRGHDGPCPLKNTASSPAV